jgi:tRNA (cmo5U34)-methyltransferase
MDSARRITQDEFFYVGKDNYDETVEMAIPFYALMHEEIVRIAAGRKSSSLKIIDLGSGTGRTSHALLSAFPGSRVRAIDLFDSMHKHARIRLAEYADAVDFVTDDFMYTDLGAPVDLCVSCLAIHHQTPAGKKALFERVHSALLPGGMFLMADWSCFASPLLDQISGRLAEQLARANIDDVKAADDWCVHWRTRNIPSATDDMCTWLRDAGFVHAECVVRYYGMSLVCAIKAE